MKINSWRCSTLSKIRFADPFFSQKIKKDILESIRQVLDSGWLTMGQQVKSVEQFFSKYFSHPHVVAMNSCTATLHVALQLAGVSKESEVILPSNTFTATANSVLYNQGKPVFAEIDPTTMNLDPSDVEHRITEKTNSIIVVHIAGLPCNMKEFQRIASENNLTLIEDCAHALGSEYNGKACGTFGDYSCFSFYPTKVLAGAEGGLLLTPNSTSELRSRILLNQGRAGVGSIDITEIGYNYRMNELQACVLLPQLPYLDRFIEKRNMIARLYQEMLSDIDGIEQIEHPDNIKHSYYSYLVKLPLGVRNEVMEQLKNTGIETSVLYNPVHLQPAYRNIFGFSPGDYPVTEEACSRILSLPMHLGLTKEKVQFVCAQLKSIMVKIHST